MKNKITEVLSILDKYGIRKSYADLLCIDADGHAFFQVKQIDYDYEKKYTTKFEPHKYIFTFSIIGLSDIFPSMPVMDLITNKGIRYVEVNVDIEVKDGLEKSTNSVDNFGFNLNA